MKILNLYAGIGGNRKLWEGHEITAVEHNSIIAGVYKQLFPNDIVFILDAHKYLLNYFEQYDFIWSSPPCYSHSRMMKFTRHTVYKYPDMSLYQEILFLKDFFKGKWIVENVVPYYDPLIPGKKIGRHLVWSNFPISNFNVPKFKGDYTKAYKPELEKYYDIYFDKNIYYNNSHDPAKVLRDCTHPKLGLHILNCALNIITKENIHQTELFNQTNE